jgi:hypothetical protein
VEKGGEHEDKPNKPQSGYVQRSRLPQVGGKGEGAIAMSEMNLAGAASQAVA